jgi:hypothetical protein
MVKLTACLSASEPPNGGGLLDSGPEDKEFEILGS